MSEKRYYWLKLHDDFFSSKRIKKLRSLAGGDTYTIIYLKMQLKALKTDGYLYFDGVSEDFASELALDIDETPDDVRITIQYLLSVGLMECSGDEYCLTYMQNLIGSENASTQRVRDHRAKQKALQCNTDVTETKRLCNAEIEIEKETRDRDKECKHTHGQFKNVLLTDKEYEKLKNEFPEADEAIEFLSAYIAEKGYKSKSHYLTIRRWVIKAVREQAEKPKIKTNTMTRMLTNPTTGDDLADLERRLMAN